MSEVQLRRMEMDADEARGYYARHGTLPTATGLDVIERVREAVAELRTLRAAMLTSEADRVELQERRSLDEHRRRSDEELIARRAADITSEEREALVHMVNIWRVGLNVARPMMTADEIEQVEAALQVLARLTGGAK